MSGPLGPGDVARFRDLVRERVGLSFPASRLPDVEGAVRRAVAETGLPDAGALYRALADRTGRPEALDALVSALNVSETHFLRDRNQVEALARRVLPELLGRIERIFQQLELRNQARQDVEVTMQVGERTLAVTADKQQIIELLFSTFEELGRVNAELQEAAAEADRANRAKSEFLSRMSHELRTPLNAILGFGQLLEIDELGPEQLDGVRQILGGGRHLLDLINEVLDISRIEAGRMSLSIEPVPVAQILHEALDLVRPLVDQRGIRLEMPPQGLCERHVRADRQRLKQIVLNLLSNAVKYNRREGTVAISCRETSRPGLRIEVRDTGHGIPPDKLERLFTPFDRLGAEESTEEGTGLGLALAKKLAEVMGGTMGVESALEVAAPSGWSWSRLVGRRRRRSRPGRSRRPRPDFPAGPMPSSTSRTTPPTSGWSSRSCAGSRRCG
jgi:signal transduction histidine kinase